jgi:hypothetical protein
MRPRVKSHLCVRFDTARAIAAEPHSRDEAPNSTYTRVALAEKNPS